MTKVTTINTLSIKPGRQDDYISAQSAFASAMAGRENGLIGGRIYRSTDGTKIVLVSQFESREAQIAVMRSSELAQHLAELREFVDESKPGIYEEAYTYGNFG